MEFSVLISVYHKENPSFFSKALLSLVEQKYLPNEIVLVKDGPLTEALDSVINLYVAQYPNLFKIVTLNENKGLGTALMVGLEKCTYDWVARMDTDDICLPHRFEQQVNFLKKNQHIDVLGTNMKEFNLHPGDMNSYRKMPESGKRLLKYSKFRSPVNHPSIIFKKEAVLRNGSYNGNIPLFEDYVLFVKMLSNGAIFHNLQEVLLYFRVGDGLDMIKRRSGIKYLRNELKFLKIAVSVGHLSYYDAAIHLLTRIPLRFMPPRLVLFIYKKFLRDKNP